MTIEMKAVRIDYRKLNLACAYCSGPVEIIRVTQTNTGDVLVSTMCTEHARAEKESAISGGMTMMGESSVAGVYTDATLIDMEIMSQAVREATTADADEVLAVMREQAVKADVDA